MIIPYLDYGDVIYGTASQDGLDKLQRLQNRCLKICKRVNVRFNTNDLHAVTETPLLKDRRRAHLNNFMYDRLSRHELRDDREIRTRAHDAPLFKAKVPKLEAYKRSVNYSGAVQWNGLSAEMHNMGNKTIFKAKQKSVMLALIPDGGD